LSREQAAHTTAGKRRQWSVVSNEMSTASPLPRFTASAGFTLAELLISMGVLVLLVLLFTQLLNSAATVTIHGHKQMDADSQAREVLDRVAIDLAQMVKRSDVDYYLKASGVASDCGACGPQTGANDQWAFYSTVPGHYRTVPTPPPSYTDKSPVSVVSYRINPNSAFSSYNRIERLGKGLAWIGFSPNWTPVMFLPQSIIGNWGGSNSVLFPSSEASSQYETIGPQVFRFEYYYLLQGQVVNGTTYNPVFSATPWDIRIPGHTNVSGMRDVSAIIADIAVIDPKSKVLVPVSQMEQLAGTNGQTSVLVDYSPGMIPGQLLANWRNALDTNTVGLRQPAISGIRVFERYFYLNQ
jgi:hypothetical protein